MLQPKIIPTLVRTILKKTVAYNADSPPPDPPSTQRYFISLPGADSYYAFSDTITLTGDFELSFEFQTTDTGVRYFAYGASNNYLRMSSGAFRFRMNDGVSSSTVTTPLTYNDGKLHLCSIKIESGVQTVSMDGAVVVTNESPVSHVDWVLDEIGVYLTGTVYWEGMLVNPSIDDITADEQYSWVLGNETSNTEVSNGITLTYTAIPATQAYRELYELSGDETQWDNISPATQQLPAVIEIA